MVVSVILPDEVKLDLVLLSRIQTFQLGSDGKWITTLDFVEQVKLRGGRCLFVKANRIEFPPLSDGLVYSHCEYFFAVNKLVYALVVPFYECQERCDLISFLHGFKGNLVKSELSVELTALAKTHRSEAVRRKALSLLKELEKGSG